MYFFLTYVDTHERDFSNRLLIVVEQRSILEVVFDRPRRYEHSMVDFHCELNYVDNQCIDQSHRDDAQCYPIVHRNRMQMVEEFAGNLRDYHMPNCAILEVDFLPYFEQSSYEDKYSILE